MWRSGTESVVLSAADTAAVMLPWGWSLGAQAASLDNSPLDDISAICGTRGTPTTLPKLGE